MLKGKGVKGPAPSIPVPDVGTTQAHIGNTAQAGDILPAVAVRIFGEGENPPVNFQVFLDGNDTYWATSRVEDATQAQGTWHWPVITR